MSDPVITPGVEATPAAVSAPAPSPAPEATDPNAGGQIQQTADPVVATEPELFELPDGRKVDAATLADEWKTNFMPDYTQKSQRLSEIQKQFGQQPQQQQVPNSNQPSQQPEPAWKSPNWVPQTYQEIIDAAKQEMKMDQVAQQQQQEQYKQQVNTIVDGQLAELRKVEPNLSEELLFQHAHKYGFGDLKTAYQNMKDFNMAVAKTAAQTTKNIQQRAADPIGGRPGTADPSTGLDYNQISRGNMNAVEFLRKLQGK